MAIRNFDSLAKRSMGELVIVNDNINGSILAWKFSVNTLKPYGELLILIDAVSGEAISRRSMVLDVNVTCSAETKYNGVQSITGDSYSGGIRLNETRNGVLIQTQNLHKQISPFYATDFINSNTSWINGSWPGFPNDQQALDVHWASEMFLDYWNNVHNRNSIIGSGMTVTSYVHTSPGGSIAFWSLSANSIFYNDGDGTFAAPTSLDVCAHEMAHGIHQFTSNRGSSSGNQEADALNEGLSDIGSAVISNYFTPAKQIWLVGNEIFKSNVYSCIRNIQNPKSTTASEGQHPDMYHGNFWNSFGDAHFNSTVLSHWFYLISMGGSSTREDGSPYFINAIGINRSP